MNHDINVDINDLSLSTHFSDKCVKLLLYSFYEQGVRKNNDLSINDYFPDEDFCLYERIPIQQLISIVFRDFPHNYEYCSCTYSWIILKFKGLFDFCNWELIGLYYEIYNYYNSSKFDECNFEKRL